MQKASSLFILFLFLCPRVVCGQENETVRDIIENLTEDQASDDDLSELSERLEYYLKHPIDLNKTNAAQLKELVFLSPLQINNFFDHVRASGKIADILELQVIDGFDLLTIRRLIPFISIGPSITIPGSGLKDLYKKADHDLIVRYGRILERQRGFTDLPGSRYLGTAGKLLVRYKYNYGKFLSAALVAEKDAGEYLFKKYSGTDHLSFHIAFKGPGRLKKLVLGDYSLQFGQGLTLWSGFSFGKGPDVTSVASRDLGLRPYNSSNESSFFRGLAGTSQICRNIELTSFISIRKLDASLKYKDGENPTLQNINISGLHRTATELRNQKSLRQLVYGAVLQYTVDNLTIGLTGYQSNYQHAFVTGNQRYNKYAFSGKDLFNTGFHYNYTFRNIYFYGELGHSFSGGQAIINGAMASLSPKVSVVLLHRSYDRNYHNFFSSGIGEGTEVSNEKGFYAGINYAPVKKWIFSFYHDYFRFPWLKYRVDSASSGYELSGQMAYIPNKIFKALVRYKREIKQQNPDAGSTSEHLLANITKQSFRLDWNWQPRKRFSFHQRIELAHFQKENKRAGASGFVSDYGLMLLQDIDFKPLYGSISGNMRLAYFNTASYESRIYVYEDDVLYGAASGAYSGNGLRAYLNLRFHIVKHMDVWTRYAIYKYFDKELIGTGLDEIKGSIKSDFKVQFRYQF